jgi:hypothetical protein
MGPPDFERLRLNAERMNLGAFSALVASIPDLIAMKRSAGRPKDEVDSDELLAIERVARRLED